MNKHPILSTFTDLASGFYVRKNMARSNGTVVAAAMWVGI
jgi:hypothetical protein